MKVLQVLDESIKWTSANRLSVISLYVKNRKLLNNGLSVHIVEDVPEPILFSKRSSLGKLKIFNGSETVAQHNSVEYKGIFRI